MTEQCYGDTKVGRVVSVAKKHLAKRDLIAPFGKGSKKTRIETSWLLCYLLLTGLILITQNKPAVRKHVIKMILNVGSRRSPFDNWRK